MVIIAAKTSTKKRRKMIIEALPSFMTILWIRWRPMIVPKREKKPNQRA